MLSAAFAYRHDVVHSHYWREITRKARIAKGLAMDTVVGRMKQEEPEPSRTFDERRCHIDRLVRTAVARGDFVDALPGMSDSLLGRVCAKAVSGGKRLRPVLLMDVASATARAVGECNVDASPAAMALEYLHSASLIVDDLPSFDNDTQRRGKPSAWAQSDSATANMAAVVLMAQCTRNIARQIEVCTRRRHRNAGKLPAFLVDEFGSGLSKTAVGQFMDSCSGTTATQKTMSASEFAALVAQRKTAPFFEMAVVCGWVLGGGDLAHGLDRARKAGRHFGTAFQIADDVADEDHDRQQRTAGMNVQNVAVEAGHDEAVKLVHFHLRSCDAELRHLSLMTPVWLGVMAKVRGMLAINKCLGLPENEARRDVPSLVAVS